MNPVPPVRKTRMVRSCEIEVFRKIMDANMLSRAIVKFEQRVQKPLRDGKIDFLRTYDASRIRASMITVSTSESRKEHEISSGTPVPETKRTDRSVRPKSDRHCGERKRRFGARGSLRSRGERHWPNTPASRGHPHGLYGRPLIDSGMINFRNDSRTSCVSRLDS